MKEKNVDHKGNGMSATERADEQNMLRILVKKYPFTALDYIPRDKIYVYLTKAEVKTCGKNTGM